MQYNLKTETGRQLAKEKFDLLMSQEKTIKLEAVRKKRSNKLNSALHLYFSFVSTELNNQGQTFNYTLSTGQLFETRYTPEIIKDRLWRPIQIVMFKIKSTKDVDSPQINLIIDVTNKYLSNFGICIEFPNIQSLMHQMDIKSGRY